MSKKQNGDNIWTLIDEDDKWTIINGFHIVNRIGYFITKKGKNEI